MSSDFIFLLKAAILGVVEGVTEFLPISSTAHLLILGDWLNFDAGQDKVYEIVIQLGSILAIVWLYRSELLKIAAGSMRARKPDLLFVRNILLAFLPAAVIGLIFIKQIKKLLDDQFIVYAITLVLGGLIMLWVESRPEFSKRVRDDENIMVKSKTLSIEEISIMQALAVGFAQCLAMIPGTSRSGASIIAGMMAGIERKVATEFSFFLAIPTMMGATALSIYKYGHLLSESNIIAVVIGFVTAFFSALLVVKGLLRFVAKHSYVPFAWYRIVFGAIVALWVWNIL